MCVCVCVCVCVCKREESCGIHAEHTKAEGGENVLHLKCLCTEGKTYRQWKTAPHIKQGEKLRWSVKILDSNSPKAKTETG